MLGVPESGGVLTLVNRVSKYLVTEKIEDKCAHTLMPAIQTALKGLPLCTITVDNGKEFAGHRKISEMLGSQVYFAHPHSPWERGTNENTNGLLREFLPKGIDFRGVSNW